MQEGIIREGDILGVEAESLRLQGTWQHLNLRQADPTACSLQPKALTPTDNWRPGGGVWKGQADRQSYSG